MKYISPLQKSLHGIRSKKIGRYKARKRRWIRRARAARSLSYKATAPTHWGSQYVLTVPTVLKINEGSSALQLLSNLRTFVFQRRRKVLLDFSNLKHFDLESLLMLVAEIQRIMLQFDPEYYAKDPNDPATLFVEKAPFINGTFPKDRRVAYFLKSLGFYELIRVPSGTYSEFELVNTVKLIKFKTGNTQDEHSNKAALALVREAQFLYGIEEQLQHITHTAPHSTLHEAITNVVDHAYPESMSENPPYLKNQWWMTGLVDKEKGKSTLLICDQGVGIPETIPKEFLKKHNLSLRRQKDGEIIEVAIKEGVTSKPDAGRGKGLSYMIEFVTAINSIQNVDAELIIYSGKGFYLHDKDGPRSGELKHDMGGTMIRIMIDRQAA